MALSRIDADSAEFELQVTGTATKSVTLKSIFFQQVLVNGIPIRVPPIEGPLKLRVGEDLTGLPVLTALVPFREVPSLGPLRELVAGGEAHVHGVALVRLDLNPLEMLALRSTSLWAAINIDQDVAIHLPGGILGRAAALAALSAAEPAWVLGNEGREWRRRRSAFAAQAEEVLAKAGVPIECSYEISSRTGETRLLHSESLGFMLPSGRILTTAEAVEPWAFDSAMAESLSRHDIAVTQESVEILARPEGAIFSTKRKELKVIKQRGEKKHMISAEDKATYRLRFRNSDDNAVVLELKGFHAEEQSKAAAQIVRNDQSPVGEWQPAALLRTDLDTQTAPYVWITEAKKENGRWVLKDPAGVTALGSPIWTEDGVVGLVQDDTSGAATVNLLKSFRSELL